MATLQELDTGQITPAFRAAAERCVPLTVCVQQDGRWANLRSRIIAVREDRILIEMPAGEEGSVAYEFTPAEKIGLTFKLKHHKHICGATVAGPEPLALEDGAQITVLSVCWPTRMHRLQRRSYLRVDVPANRIVRVTFWLGGVHDEPAGGASSTPFWSGQAVNISAGGLQMRSTKETTGAVEVGDVVGMRLLFGLGSEAVYVDAQFRHAEEVNGEALLGFQFLGLGQTRQSQEALKIISAKVADFQHAAAAHDAARR